VKAGEKRPVLIVHDEQEKGSHPAMLSHTLKMAAPAVLPLRAGRCNTGNESQVFSGVFLQFIDGISRGTPEG
jgi:hypothetical protein